MDSKLSLKNIKKYIPYAIIALSFVVLLVRGFYSFCWTDETFYFSTADRFYKGDKIFIHDWFPTQLSGVFILPFYALFVKITGSITGIFLFFRVLYAVIELIYGIIVYRLIKDIHGAFTALVISLFAMFYTHLNIATVSYYTMSVTFFLLSMLLLYRFYKIDGSKNRDLVISGVCFALSVFNLPTLAAAYVLIIACGFVLFVLAKLLKKEDSIDDLKLPAVFKYTLTGILIPAAIFVVYLLLNVSVSDFINSIPYILSDDEHATSTVYPLRKMYLAIIESYGSKIFYFGCLITILAIISWLLYSLSKFIKITGVIEKLLPALNTAVVILDIIAFFLYLYKSAGYTGYIQTAVMMFALPLFFITRKKDVFAFLVLFMSGITFSLVFSYSSSGMLYIISLGHFIASIGGIIFIKEYVCELTEAIKNKESASKNMRLYVKAVSAIICACILISLINTAYCRIFNVYRDDKLSNLTAVITDGPAKGLRTNPEHKEMYDEVYDVLIKHCKEGNLLISKLLPWGYMCNNGHTAAPTTWRSKMDNDRLFEYYEIHPDRYPDTILVLDEYYCSYEECGDVERDYTPNENVSEGCVYDYISNNNFVKKEVPCGTLYTRLPE